MLVGRARRRDRGVRLGSHRRPRIGPLVAEIPSSPVTPRRQRFARAAGSRAARLNLPPGNRPGAAWLGGLGVEVEPWDGRMARGPQIPRREETIYGNAVGALG